MPTLWALGVLSTTSHHPVLLAELHRVLEPGGGLGLLVYAASPAGGEVSSVDTDLPAADALPGMLEDASFDLIEVVEASELMDAPRSWTDRLAAVEGWIAERHDHEAAWRTAESGESRLTALLRSGVVRPFLVHARAR